MRSISAVKVAVRVPDAASLTVGRSPRARTVLKFAEEIVLWRRWDVEKAVSMGF